MVFYLVLLLDLSTLAIHIQIEFSVQEKWEDNSALSFLQSPSRPKELSL